MKMEVFFQMLKLGVFVNIIDMCRPTKLGPMGQSLVTNGLKKLLKLSQPHGE